MVRIRRFALMVCTIPVAAACRGSTEPTLCSAPAPLFGQADPRAPGFIVVYRDAVDATAETERLAARYSFRPSVVWDGAGLRGFAAQVSSSTVASLRCEPAVRYVEHEALVRLGADDR